MDEESAFREESPSEDITEARQPFDASNRPSQFSMESEATPPATPAGPKQSQRRSRFRPSQDTNSALLLGIYTHFQKLLDEHDTLLKDRSPVALYLQRHQDTLLAAIVHIEDETAAVLLIELKVTLICC